MAKSAVIGLDIGTTFVRGAEVEQSGRSGHTLVRYGQVPLPLGAVRDGEVAEPETVASALRQLWSQAKFSSREVNIGIGNQRVLVRELDMPAMPMAQIRSSLPFQVQDLLPVAVEDALLDYYPTAEYAGPNGPAVTGLLVAATKDTVQANTIAVETAGLRPVMVDLSAFALTRAQLTPEMAARTVALVDLGGRTTTVVVLANGMPKFIRMLPSGGQDVTEAVTSAMNVSVSDAERIKRELGVGFQVAPEMTHVAESIYSVTSTLIDSVRNTLVYYASNHPGAAADGIILTGGGAQLPGLGQYLASATRLPVSLGQPLASFKTARSAPQGDALAAIQHDCAIAVGLALGVAA
ncbi:type IV pilus assembly protein PilM [Actinotalea sp.]|uniref:type IV pilus assembly protein PilM n=1 Tax=Actinotalea sp. TaxID=1872145 RepID=UPI002B5714FD|nr:type IV pilus assembly protein PilM [Actinotalea sp.]HQY33849.1 type IV pilus assembly protein PilM [Actinotalea sp.]HRA50015.1 type IV pilus assembly protein PilM [Actinotalea sp.]